MKRRMFCLLMAILQMIITWYSATSRPFGSDDVSAKQDRIPHFPQAAFDLKQGLIQTDGVVYEDEETKRGLSRIGSRPPSCKRKCEGCTPCDAIQIPETTGPIHVQYANYKPEGWKCKCGTTFYNP